MQKPVISLTLAYISGILLGHGFLYFPCSITVLVVLSVLFVGMLIRLDKLSFRRSLLFVIPGLIGIVAYLYSAIWLPADHYTHIFPEDKAIHKITGRIASALDRDPDRTSFILDLMQIGNKTVSGKVRVSVREALSSIGYHDVVRISGKLFEPGGFKNPGSFDYAAYLARNGIYRMVSVKSAEQIQILLPGNGIFRTIQNWRERIRQAFLSDTSGPGSAILQAMVLGEEGGLTDEMRDRFLAAGVTHIISISGSHLGMVAVICFGMIRLIMRLLPRRTYHKLTIYADPKKIAAWMTLPLVIFYTLLAGGQMATVRSLMMIMAALAALILDRENALIHSLATAAFLILAISPQALFDISFQLSFISVFVIGSVVLLWNELQFNQNGLLRKLGLNASLLIIISFSTSLATGPLVAHYFNQISLAGIFSNIIIVPFAGMLVVPVGLFSGILSLFTHHLLLAGTNQFLADAFISTVTFFSRLPIAEFHPRSPGVVPLLCYAAIIISLFSLLRARLLFTLKPLEYSSRVPKDLLMVVGFSASLLVMISASALFPKHAAEVCFPDVGQGDCTLIQLSSGKNILIDGGGTHDNRFDIGRRILAPFLWNRGVRKLDLVILTHPHPDHMNGLKFILKKFGVSEIWTHCYDGDLPGYEDFNQIVTERRISRKIVLSGSPPLQLGEAELRVLHPSRTFASREKKAYAAENDRSLVMRIAFSDRVLLLTGDIGTGAEKEMLRNRQHLKCDLLKVPHHGSKSSSSGDFISTARPALAVFTVGRGNRYHHPSDEVIDRYERYGARILRTDRDGAVVLKMIDKTISVTTWNDMEFRKIDGIDQLYAKRERENWKRLWLRKWEL